MGKNQQEPRKGDKKGLEFLFGAEAGARHEQEATCQWVFEERSSNLGWVGSACLQALALACCGALQAEAESLYP